MNHKNPVILISADQLRADMLGRGFTPTIDSLMSESIEFSRAYCTSPLCVPARGSLFTGRFPSSTGSLINPWFDPDKPFGLVRKGIPHFYQIMAEAGYDCFHTGKQHLYLEEGQPEFDSSSPVKWVATEKTYLEYLKVQGIQVPGGPRYRSIAPKLVTNAVTKAKRYSNPRVGVYEEDASYYFDHYFIDQLLLALETRDPERPLCISAMFLAPHPPFCIPEPYFSMYRADDVPLPENVGIWAPRQSPFQLYHITGSIGSSYTREEWQETWRVYAGLCTLLDDQVKRILDYLRAEGLYDESLIIFTSDHGEMLGSHQLFQKMCMYEEAARVPLLIKLPGVSEHYKQDTLVSHVDLLPTLLEYLGIEKPHVLDGVDLLKGDKKRPIFIQFDGTDYLGNQARAIIEGDFKLIVDFFKDEIYFELYNLADDVQEQENLVFDLSYHHQIQDMLKTLRTHMQETGDYLSIPEIDLVMFMIRYSV